ncbi:MAG: YceI family protein [Gemmatimonadetes bacterium]|nr:YceI family protein [Gemmatimonadota bacterium]
MKSKTGYANVKDTIIPLYPRKRVRPLCEEAVSGEILVADTTSLRGVHGIISVTADKLTTGMGMRDNYARNSILQTATHPTIKFTIDSVSQLTKAHGDTLRGNAYGVFSLHGVDRPMSATLKTWHEAGGLRVQAKFMVKASDLIDVYRMSKYSLGLGVGNSIWEELHMGVDVVLRPAAGT